MIMERLVRAWRRSWAGIGCDCWGSARIVLNALANLASGGTQRSSGNLRYVLSVTE